MIKLRHYFIAIAILLAFFITGCCIDLNASEVLFNSNNNFAAAIVASDYATMLFFFSTFLVILTFIITIPKDKKWLTWIPIVILLACFGYCVYEYFISLREFSGSKYWWGTNEVTVYGDLGMWINNAIMLVVILVSVFLVWKFFFSKIDKTMLFKASIVAAIIILLDVGISTGLKFLWSRPRPWYVFMGVSGMDPKEAFKTLAEPVPFKALFSEPGIDPLLFKSFPSGHTGRGATTIMGLLPFTICFKSLNNERNRTFIFYMGLLLTIVLGSLRVLGGAHFISDVAFGSILAVTISYFALMLSSKYKLLDFELKKRE